MADLWSFAAGAAAATAVGCCASAGRARPPDARCADMPDEELFELFDRFEDVVRQRFPKRVILVRHGESEGNVNLDIYETKPDAALRLTAKGQAQAVAAGKKLKADIGDSKVHFIVSPYTRTRETLHGILQAFDDPSQICSIVEDPRIREQEFGMYQVRALPASLSLARARSQPSSQVYHTVATLYRSQGKCPRLCEFRVYVRSAWSCSLSCWV